MATRLACFWQLTWIPLLTIFVLVVVLSASLPAFTAVVLPLMCCCTGLCTVALWCQREIGVKRAPAIRAHDGPNLLEETSEPPPSTMGLTSAATQGSALEASPWDAPRPPAAPPPPPPPPSPPPPSEGIERRASSNSRQAMDSQLRAAGDESRVALLDVTARPSPATMERELAAESFGPPPPLTMHTAPAAVSLAQPPKIGDDEPPPPPATQADREDGQDQQPTNQRVETEIFDRTLSGLMKAQDSPPTPPTPGPPQPSEEWLCSPSDMTDRYSEKVSLLEGRPALPAQVAEPPLHSGSEGSVDSAPPRQTSAAESVQPPPPPPPLPPRIAVDTALRGPTNDADFDPPPTVSDYGPPPRN